MDRRRCDPRTPGSWRPRAPGSYLPQFSSVLGEGSRGSAFRTLPTETPRVSVGVPHRCRQRRSGSGDNILRPRPIGIAQRRRDRTARHSVPISGQGRSGAYGVVSFDGLGHAIKIEDKPKHTEPEPLQLVSAPTTTMSCAMQEVKSSWRGAREIIAIMEEGRLKGACVGRRGNACLFTALFLL